MLAELYKRKTFQTFYLNMELAKNGARQNIGELFVRKYISNLKIELIYSENIRHVVKLNDDH